MSNPVTISDCKCVLVIGATAGLGRALALAIHELPSKPTVIAAGRRQQRLDELAKQGARIKTLTFDVNVSRDALKSAVQDVCQKYPELDAVLFVSGVQHLFDFKKPETVNLDILEGELNTNYTAIARMVTFFLPHFLKLSDQARPSLLVTVTSGLGIVPGPWVPNYCATKAALHSLTLSLHNQLSDTKVKVAEIFPPLVESELHDHQGTTPKLSKMWLPLEDFTKEAMEGLKRGDVQIPVGRVKQQWDIFEKGKLEKSANSMAIFSKAQ
ncbi:NAD(P)-binding protein [Daedalea quercina L-15889]|uniref:NAD(P)-binding protein n=1 Tax=Daedalea quercina L-15889 TaxID=1314783 RepID=A0A165UNG5_9APHY|nr:NAD(P)-binding protein [Daedalea quercina L-15889]